MFLDCYRCIYEFFSNDCFPCAHCKIQRLIISYKYYSTYVDYQTRLLHLFIYNVEYVDFPLALLSCSFGNLITTLQGHCYCRCFTRYKKTENSQCAVQNSLAKFCWLEQFLIQIWRMFCGYFTTYYSLIKTLNLILLINLFLLLNRSTLSLTCCTLLTLDVARMLALH